MKIDYEKLFAALLGLAVGISILLGLAFVLGS